ncbi:MAG: beta-galactosidase [Puniceicoccaceae bacterium 5H]|nr:MAG: beta-galactosidase [Puniceicoccaceae bacterium 5H]
MDRRAFLKWSAAGVAGVSLLSNLPAFAREMGEELSRPRNDKAFNRGWRFIREPVEQAKGALFDDGAWQQVTLPHTAQVEAAVTGAPGSDTAQWQGVCWYRKHFNVDAAARKQHALLKFEGAMNVADVWLNGAYLGRHQGGFLPFTFDVTERLRPGEENVLAVRLDNTDNPVTGPKPLDRLDFNTYGGLYRDVQLILKDRLHITDPLHADKVASGGLFVRFPEVTPEAAQVCVQTHVANAYLETRDFRVRAVLEAPGGETVAKVVSEPLKLAGGRDTEVLQTLKVEKPALWSPKHPHLHTLHVTVLRDGQAVDTQSTRVGIRRIEMSRDGFKINGEPMFLRGTNRHQEYPYVGYALSDAAQYRDARHIKEAGFDYIRLSHYPHSPAFMDACDELGLVVMNCIPGWQYFNTKDPEFAQLQYWNSRQMIRRDRNHPCVILWEVSLNETRMPEEFIRHTQALAHDEFPGDQCYTCGWTDGYDVFIQARQHGGCREVTDRPCVVSEYGDWEYYAQNAGLDQGAWADLAPDDANSRQLRWHGEKAMLQQATNFQEAHNDNLKTIAFADGLWVMFDYNRGYAPDIESSGCMDLFRLPKFAYYFYRSQRDADEHCAQAETGPMVFIANYWQPDSTREVRVFSNGDEVALRLNGKLIERRSPDDDRISSHLAHPPFTFHLPQFASGELEAVAYLRGQEVARHTVRTPGQPEQLEVSVDLRGEPFAVAGKDVVIAHATLRDAQGTTVADAWENVFFGATGPVELVGANPFSSSAGIASILVQTEATRPQAALFALAVVSDGQQTRVLHHGLALRGKLPAYEVRWTDDGSEPTRRSRRYEGPIRGAKGLRAAVFVDGERIALSDPQVEKFRLAGSTAPRK